MRRKRGFIFLSRCCLDSLVFCGGTGSGDAVKIWSLHLASYWLHIQAIIENTLIIYLFKRIPFFSPVFHAGQQRLKGMFQVLSGSTLQLLDLRARGVSWWKTKTLGYAEPQDVLFAPFPGKRIFAQSERRARHQVVADRMATLGFSEDRGHLTSLSRSAVLTTASVY